MFRDQEQELARLRDRKRELIARSHRQREQIREDLKRLEPVLSVVERGSILAGQVGPWISRTLPVVRSWFTPADPGSGVVGKVQHYLSVFKSAAKLGASLFGRRKDSAPTD